MVIGDNVLSIIREFSSSRDSRFFDRLTLGLASAVSADYVYIATLNKERSHATTLSICKHSSVKENFCYSLLHTPSAYVSKDSVAIYDGNAQSHFPKDTPLVNMGVKSYFGIPLHDRGGEVIGILAALYQNTISQLESTQALFQLFAGMVGTEIEQKAYREKLILMSTVVEKSHQSIVILDADQKIEYHNQLFEKMTGYSQEEIQHLSSDFFYSGLHSNDFIRGIQRCIFKEGTWFGELLFNRKEDSPIHVNVVIHTIKDSSGAIEKFIISALDITDQKVSEKEAYQKENFDRLTGLPNTYFFQDHLLSEIKAASESGSIFAVLLIDIDNFKAINDASGISLGDKVIIRIGHRINSALPENSVFSRMRSVQFCVLIPNLDLPIDVAITATRIQEKLKESFLIPGSSLQVTASIGISSFPQNSQTPDGLLYQAEQAMYSAKKQGKNCFRFFNSVMQSNAETRVSIKNKLEQAIKDNAFTLAFQPITEFDNPSLTKFEVLLRWFHEGAWVPPGEFISVAEEFSLMGQIGELVLEMACAALQRFHRLGYRNICFAINRSVHEFPKTGSDQPTWLKTIADHDLEPSSVCFEITESILSPDNDSLLDYLHKLRNAGCQIAIDDFGTGYSSLSYIRRFPVDILKIDRSFITEIVENESDKILVSTILAMGSALGMKIVAEGIETKQQLQLLQDLGCHYIQGFLLSKPLSEKDALLYTEGYQGLIPYLD